MPGYAALDSAICEALRLSSGSLTVREALGPQETRFGEGPALVPALTLVAEFHKRVGNTDEAGVLFARAEQIMNAHQLAPRGEITTCMNIGRFEDEQGRLTRALEFLERGLRVANEEFGPNSALAIMMEVNIGRALYNHDDSENALIHLQRAWELEESAATPNQMSRSYIHEHIGLCQSALGNHAAALESWLAALEIRTKELGPDQPRTQTILHRIRGLCDDAKYTPACDALP